jgi:hypothetical protein
LRPHPDDALQTLRRAEGHRVTVEGLAEVAQQRRVPTVHLGRWSGFGGPTGRIIAEGGGIELARALRRLGR